MPKETNQQAIDRLAKQLDKTEKKLFNLVMAKDNSMNECDCQHSITCNFESQVSDGEVNKFCLKCGGYVEPQC